MATLEEIHHQESSLKQKVSQFFVCTNNITGQGFLVMEIYFQKTGDSAVCYQTMATAIYDAQEFKSLEQYIMYKSET